VGVVLGWLGSGFMFLRAIIPADPPPWVDLVGIALLARSLTARGRWGGNPEMPGMTGLPFGAVALALRAHHPWAAFPPRRG